MPDQTITGPELADLREATESWFTDTCDIYGHSPGAGDGYGGYSVDPEILKQAGVLCQLESGAEHVQTRALIAKIENVQTFTITLPALTDVELGDHLIITSQNDLHLRVEAAMAPESWEIERRVIGSQLGEHHV